MYILLPETDNCPSCISGRDRMTVENISISKKECCQPWWGLNPRPPGLQLDIERVGLSVQEKKRKIDFKMAAMRPSWISNQNNFSYFCSTSHPYASYQVSSQLAFQFRRRSDKRFSKWPFWIPEPNILALFRSINHPKASYLGSSQFPFRFRKRSEK